MPHILIKSKLTRPPELVPATSSPSLPIRRVSDDTLVIDLPDSEQEQDELFAEDILRAIIQVCQTIGAGVHEVRGFESDSSFSWSTQQELLSWHPWLLWGIPVLVDARADRPIISIRWSWLTDFIREHAAGHFPPERVTFSYPVRILLETVSELFTIHGEHLLSIDFDFGDQ